MENRILELPLVSVLIPIYNSARYLKEALDSVVFQTYKNLEIIIIDDSPNDDGSRAIIESYCDNRIKYIKPEKRLGIVGSLNYAISISKGEYLARMDGDDITHIKRFELQIEYLLKHPDVGVVGCGAYTINAKSKVTGVEIHPKKDCNIKAKMLFNCSFMHPDVMIRKKVLDEVGVYDEGCFSAEDYNLWSRMIGKTKFHNMNNNLLKYRILDNSAMHKQLKRIQEDDDYYRQYKALLGTIHDNVLSYYNIKGESLDSDYLELLISKRDNQHTLAEREAFLMKCMNVLSGIADDSYLKRCIGYQWIKMSRKMFYKARNKRLVFWSIKEMIIYELNNIKAKMLGVLFINKNSNNWKLFSVE